MPCPFPGMDPFLESQMWSDFHPEFIVAVRSVLVPVLPPQYAALIEKRVYVEFDSHPPRFAKPDLTIAEPRAEYAVASRAGVTVGPVTVPLVMPEEMREAYIEIRTREPREVIAVIEVLSPENKRAGSRGRIEYLSKRESLLDSRTHTVETDLLRGGDRLPMAQPLPSGDYYVIVSDARKRPSAQVWAFTLRHELPVIDVPLAASDPEVKVDLQAALNTVYERAWESYQRFIDYMGEVDPPLGKTDQEWLRQLVAMPVPPDPPRFHRGEAQGHPTRDGS